MTEDRTPTDVSQSTRTLQQPPRPSEPAGSDGEARPHTRGSVFARYVVLEYLGGGGMGVVYSAYDPQLDRKVALKLLRANLFDDDRREEAQARLLREARSLAKLTHPNVVVVHDVGVAQGQIFLAMEQVAGRDVAHWLREETPGWRRVLEVFEQAGEGLAAAHRAGLLHRDFKPANVILGDDGRARVVDFGLARSAVRLDNEAEATDIAASAAESGAPSEEGPSENRPSAEETPAGAALGRSVLTKTASDPLATPSDFDDVSAVADLVTREGRVLGTPAYMAPEQFAIPKQRRAAAGPPSPERTTAQDPAAEVALAEVDARSDQFSFCASLYQALYRQLPYPQRSPLLRLAAILDHRVAEPPRGHGVPRGVGAIVLRGLSPRPDDRYESIEALLAALARQRSRRSVLAAAAVGVVLATVLAVFALRPGPCADLAAQLEGVWDDTRQSALAGAFAALDLPYAADLGERVSARLDRYAADWVAARTTACRAPLDGGQSERLTDLRTACFDRRLLDLDATVDQLLRVDADTIDRAAAASSELRSLAACADAQALLAVVPPPDEATAARAEALREALAEPRALLAVGRGPEAWERLEDLAPAIDAVGWAAAQAEAEYLVGLAASRLDRDAEALDALRRTVSAADAGGDDALRARALLEIAWLERTDDRGADAWALLSQGPLERLDDPQLWATWHRTRAQIALRRGDHVQARAAAEASVAAAIEGFGPQHLATTRMQTGLMGVLYRVGDYEEALVLLDDLVAARRALLGDTHPYVAFTRIARAEVQRYLGRFDEATEELARALAILVPIYGESHSSVAAAYSSRGVLYLRLGDLDAAEVDLRRSLTIRRDLLGDDDPSVPSTMNSLALVVWLRDDLEAAEILLREALALSVASPSRDHQEEQIVRVNLGRVLLDQGAPREALELLTVAWTETRATLPPTTDTRIDAGLAYAMALLERGRLVEAAAAVDETTTALDEAHAEPWLVGVARLAEARLRLAQGDREAARRLSTAARSWFERTPPASRSSHLQRLERWLADLGESV